MPKGYWIGHVDVVDADAYRQYAKLATDAVHHYGGRYLMRRGAHEIPEGAWRSIHVMIEFESFQRARDCYHSAEYRAARKIREGAAQVDLLIVEGCEEDAPASS